MICLFVGGIAGTTFVGIGRSTQAPQPSATSTHRLPAAYQELLTLNDAELGEVDIAVMNLLCAKGLPGAENLDIPSILATLDEWAKKVRFETERHLYRVHDPRYADHYGHSEARLRAEFLVQVLQEDCGVRYNLGRVRDVDFSKPQDLFIQGMIRSDNGGTCSSMPVLYTAVGRRLGYPMWLVLAKQHVFCRWDDSKERFNIEAAGNGGADYPPDEHYRTWPSPITDAEMASGEFLKSLTPREELATFLLQRAACLNAHQRFTAERACLAEAVRLMPNSTTIQTAIRSASGMGIPTAQHAGPRSVSNQPAGLMRQSASPPYTIRGVSSSSVRHVEKESMR